MNPLDIFTSQRFNSYIQALEGRGFIPSTLNVGENIVVKGYYIDRKVSYIDSTLQIYPNTFQDYLIETVFVENGNCLIDIGEPNSISGFSSIDVNKIVSPLPYYDQTRLPIINCLVPSGSSLILSYSKVSFKPPLFRSNFDYYQYSTSKHVGGTIGNVFIGSDGLGSYNKVENVFSIKNIVGRGKSTLTLVQHSFFSLPPTNYTPYETSTIWVRDNFFTWDIRKQGITQSDSVGDIIEDFNFGYKLWFWNNKRLICEGNIVKQEEEIGNANIFIDETQIQVYGVGGIISSNIGRRDSTLPVIQMRSCGGYVPWLFSIINNIAVNPSGDALGSRELGYRFSLDIAFHNVLDGSFSVFIEDEVDPHPIRLTKSFLHGRIKTIRSFSMTRNILRNSFESYGEFFGFSIPETPVPPNTTLKVAELPVSSSARVEIANIGVFSSPEGGTFRIVTAPAYFQIPATTLDFGSQPLSLQSTTLGVCQGTFYFYLVNNSSNNLNMSVVSLITVERPVGEFP